MSTTPMPPQNVKNLLVALAKAMVERRYAADYGLRPGEPALPDILPPTKPRRPDDR